MKVLDEVIEQLEQEEKEELEANEGGNGRASSFFDKLRCKTNRTKKYIDA